MWPAEALRLLLDTHLLIWYGSDPGRLSARARALMGDRGNTLFFSVVSLWEIVIKMARPRSNLKGDVFKLRGGLLSAGYAELLVNSDHAFAVGDLPQLHGDPFDRLLIAQARVEEMTFLTADAAIARYPGAILKV